MEKAVLHSLTLEQITALFGARSRELLCGKATTGNVGVLTRQKDTVQHQKYIIMCEVCEV
jgi:hypothetical protein